MRKVISECGFDEECADCRYLYLCKTGCPFVKRAYNSQKSYTCRLQRELYKFWGMMPSGYNDDDVYDYLKNVHPEYAGKYRPPILPNEFPSLQTVIRKDSSLSSVFEKGVFLLNVDGNEFELESQLMRQGRSFTYIHPESSVCLYVRDGLLDEVCDYPENNAVFIQLLTGDTVQYGDEGRVKQRHIATEMIYKKVLEETPSDKDGFLKFDISHFLRKFDPYLSADKPNNIFFTTSSLRDYHYAKQKNNAFYHLQTINLPFHNQEFYYLKPEEGR